MYNFETITYHDAKALNMSSSQIRTISRCIERLAKAGSNHRRSGMFGAAARLRHVAKAIQKDESRI